MAYSLESITDLGSIQEEFISKESYLTPIPLYLSDSGSTDVFDFGGCVRTITLTGIRADTVSNLQTFTGELMGLVTGAQEPPDFPKDYHSDSLNATIRVKFLGVTYSYLAGDPLRIHYIIRMIESSETG